MAKICCINVESKAIETWALMLLLWLRLMSDERSIFYRFLCVRRLKRKLLFESATNIKKAKLEHTKITVLCSNIYVSILRSLSHSQCHKYFIAFYIMVLKTIFSSASRIVCRRRMTTTNMREKDANEWTKFSSLVLWNEKVFMYARGVKMRTKHEL